MHCVRCGSYWIYAYVRVHKDEDVRKYRCRKCDERFREIDDCHAPSFGVRPPPLANELLYSASPASLEELLEKAKEHEAPPEESHKP